MLHTYCFYFTFGFWYCYHRGIFSNTLDKFLSHADIDIDKTGLKMF